MFLIFVDRNLHAWIVAEGVGGRERGRSWPRGGRREMTGTSGEEGETRGGHYHVLMHESVFEAVSFQNSHVD